MSNYSTFMLNKLSSSMFLKLYSLAFMINSKDSVYGKEILDYINSFNISWKPSHGTLYPILNKMAEENLIELTYECDGRKYYIITDWGRSYYKSRKAEFKKMLVDTSKFYKTISNELDV